MKKGRIIVIIVVLFFLLFVLSRFTGWFQVFTISSSSSEPSLKTGQIYFASNLSDYEPYDFIVYKFEDSLFGSSSFTHRLCAKSGDTISMNNGVFILNGQNFDKAISLKHNYKILKKDLLHNRNKVELEELYKGGGDTLIVAMEDHFKNKLSYSTALKYLNSDYMFKDLGFNANPNNFNNIIVPEGKLFVLGDNRDNSRDSRYIGWIDEENVLGVILN